MDGDNLRLMYSSLGGMYMLMRQSRENGTKKKNLGAERSPKGHGQSLGSQTAGNGRRINWLQVASAVMMILAAGALCAKAFQAFNCNNASAPVEQYSLLDPEPCGNLQKLHTIKRELQGEIMQIQKEQLIKVTRCWVYETITLQYCGWQSRAGVVQYLKFREPLTIEPSDCRILAKTYKIKINSKEQDFEMGVTTSFSTYLKGGLDVGNNCEVGVYEVNKVELGGQVTQAIYEVNIRQEWAKVNDLTGTLKLAESLRTATTNRAVVDSGEGTFVWDNAQDACPYTIVKLYIGLSRCLPTLQRHLRTAQP